jgi:hypothetical protein
VFSDFLRVVPYRAILISGAVADEIPAAFNRGEARRKAAYAALGGCAGLAGPLAKGLLPVLGRPHHAPSFESGLIVLTGLIDKIYL